MSTLRSRCVLTITLAFCWVAIHINTAIITFLISIILIICITIVVIVQLGLLCTNLRSSVEASKLWLFVLFIIM